MKTLRQRLLNRERISDQKAGERTDLAGRPGASADTMTKIYAGLRRIIPSFILDYGPEVPVDPEVMSRITSLGNLPVLAAITHEQTMQRQTDERYE